MMKNLMNVKLVNGHVSNVLKLQIIVLFVKILTLQDQNRNNVHVLMDFMMMEN